MKAYRFLKDLFTTDIKFNLVKINENYKSLLPDELIEHILNLIDGDSRIKKLSYVSLQFYHVNRSFVAKCYHLHHYITPVKTLIKTAINKSQIMYVLSFKNESLSLYMVEYNINKLKLINQFSVFDVLQLVDISNDNTITHYIIYDMTNIKSHTFEFKEIKEQLDLLLFLCQLDNQIIKLIIPQIIKLITIPIDLEAIKEVLLDYINVDQLLILIENLVKVYNVQLDDLLHIFNTSPTIFDTINIFTDIMDKLSNDDIANNVIERKEELLLLSNFKVLSKNTIIIMPNQCNKQADPEYRWFANRIK